MRLSILPILFLLVMALPVQAGAPQNALYNDPSPYLAMHGNDPVNWQHWDRAAIEQARRDNKLLFVSIGYFSCHWCHVMQKESYHNGEIAAFLNANFVSVKVDRELEPALDAKLIEFVQRTRGYSGWPLNVFVTPEGYPLLGLVYLPPADFRSLLTDLDALWKKDAPGLKADAMAAAQELAPQKLELKVGMQADVLDNASDILVNNMMSQADLFLGGFGEQSKFPSAPQLAALLHAVSRQQGHPVDDRLVPFLKTTLDNMSQLGLYDQLGGGFFRYSVDPQWHVPHFEKMLYDNAQLASLYLSAATILKEPRYRDIALATLRFMRKDLLTDRGAFAASLSALDDSGTEGGYYLWRKDELKKLLDERQYAIVESAWALTGAPATEDGYLPMMTVSLPMLAETTGLPVAKLIEQLEVINTRLLAERNKRVAPRDEKLLAAWNGLALSALVAASKQDPGGHWLSTANAVRHYIVSKLWDGKQLLRARDGRGNSFGTATLTDYAAVAEGLLDLGELTGNNDDKKLAQAMIMQAWQRFVNEYGFRRTERSLLALAEGDAILPDSPIYSPSSQLLRVTLRAFDKKHALHRRAVQLLAAGQHLMLEDPFWFATQVDTVVQNRALLN